MSQVQSTASTDAAHVSVQPLTVHIGAEIGGVDLTNPLDFAEIQAIRQALLKWKVIFFRNQKINHAQHVAFARQFGDPTPGHVVFGHDSEFPEIYPVTKHRKAFAAREKSNRVWTDWHTDITAAVNPPFASILRGVVVPPYGGDTQFINMAAAYEALSEPMKELLGKLRSVHRFKRALEGDDAKDYNDMLDNNLLVAEHPMITVHPETSDKVLFTNEQFADHIVGVTPRESEILYEYLWEHAARAEFMVRFRWEEGSIAFWDNRSTQHLAIRDVYDTDFDREFYRVTLNGGIPVGINGDRSERISGKPIEPV